MLFGKFSPDKICFAKLQVWHSLLHDIPPVTDYPVFCNAVKYLVNVCFPLPFHAVIWYFEYLTGEGLRTLSEPEKKSLNTEHIKT
ncbi:Uncharacterized protein dnm_093810 [Desulfonema magnum]|uniref:Uncharacterized protein n=1 Tax=Desulfonema magnum TaxID=45655 RepID=A0A975BY42_9BACT|nr:Uncharacterized protein dnm_093810 [Desulfonema magnum]